MFDIRHPLHWIHQEEHKLSDFATKAKREFVKDITYIPNKVNDAFKGVEHKIESGAHQAYNTAVSGIHSVEHAFHVADDKVEGVVKTVYDDTKAGLSRLETDLTGDIRRGEVVAGVSLPFVIFAGLLAIPIVAKFI